jgi:N-acetyl-gamma-glutamylphosphate reductase
LLAEAAYGLPEFCRERIPAARLIANPGCCPTAANLAIRPLLEAGVVDRTQSHPTHCRFQLPSGPPQEGSECGP